MRCNNPKTNLAHRARLPVAVSGTGERFGDTSILEKIELIPLRSCSCNKVAYIMDLITLEGRLRLDIPEIDSQHEELIALVNGLHSALLGGADKAARDALLSSLLERTRSHCAYEEELMSRYDYPGYQVHKAEHDRLTQNLVDLIARYQRGELLLSIAVVMELECWATIHIEKSDIPLGAFLSARKGVDPARG